MRDVRRILMRHLTTGALFTLGAVIAAWWLSGQVQDYVLGLFLLPIVCALLPSSMCTTRHLIGSALAIALPTLVILVHDRYFREHNLTDETIDETFGKIILTLSIVAYVVGIAFRYVLYGLIARLRHRRGTEVRRT